MVINTLLVARIREGANFEIRFEKVDNQDILDLNDVLPEDGKEIIFEFPKFTMHSVIKHQKYLNYVQSPKKIIFPDGSKESKRSELSYRKLWERLNFESNDKFILKVIEPKSKYKFIRKIQLITKL